MPEISLFFGIRVTINYNDHVPPHFNAEYNGNKVNSVYYSGLRRRLRYGLCGNERGGGNQPYAHNLFGCPGL